MSNYLTSGENSDFIISDRAIDSKKPVFIISNAKNSNLNKPFSKNRLIKEISNFYENSVLIQNRDLKLKLELEEISKEFVSKILKAVKEHYD